MKTMLRQYGFTVFIFIAAIHLLAIVWAAETLRFASKPLLMPLLGLAVIGSAPAGKARNIIAAGIFFSFLGDTFLLFDYINPLYFIFGLVSFLLTHILYMVYFLTLKTNVHFRSPDGGLNPVGASEYNPRSLLKKHPWIVLGILAYGFSLVYLLYPDLGELKIPVIIYAVIICSMLLCSIHVYCRVNKSAGSMFIAGALLFVVSDSLLAIAKFHAVFPAASFLIMLTYCAAQYFIAKGFVRSNDLKLPSAR